MSSFSPSEAALEGLRLTRKRPRAVLAWSAYYFLFTIILLLLGYLTLGPHAQQMLAEVRTSSSDPVEAGRLLRQTLPFFVLGMPLGLVFLAMLMGGIFRAVLSEEEPHAGVLRFGPAEWRLAVLILIAALIVTVALFLSDLAIGVATAGANAFLDIVVGLAALCATAYLFVRLSLAGPATFSEGRLIVFRSWKRTHGQFWPLLGAYVMAAALCLVMLFLMTLVSSLLFGLLAWATGWSIEGLEQAASNPPVFILAVAWQAVSSLISITSYVILLAPAAEAYKNLVASEAV